MVENPLFFAREGHLQQTSGLRESQNAQRLSTAKAVWRIPERALIAHITGCTKVGRIRFQKFSWIEEIEIN